MKTSLGIEYDERLRGPSIISFPFDLPFNRFLDHLKGIKIDDATKGRLSDIASEVSVFKRCEMLGELLGSAQDPGKLVLYVSSLAAVGDEDAVVNLYSMLTVVPAVDRIVSDYIKFRNIKRFLQRLKKKESAGEGLTENESWFFKKVQMLSTSHPLPELEEEGESWELWEHGVRKAISDPDDRWKKAIRERVKTELEARRQRLTLLATEMDPEIHPGLLTWLVNENDEIKWLTKVLDVDESDSGDSRLLIGKKLGADWDLIAGALRSTAVGGLIADMFYAQIERCHSYPQIKLGAAVIKSVLRHPFMSRSVTNPDLLSCLQVFVNSSFQGQIEMMLSSRKVEKELAKIPGFRVDEGLVKIDLRIVPGALFLERDIIPSEFDWSDYALNAGDGIKSLVLSHIDNETFLNQLLSNPKVFGKAGIVSLIAQRCRSGNVLSTIANRRELYTGFANKDVPKHLLMNPARVSLTALRKFVHVRYVDKMTLVQLSSRRGKGGQIREEVRREIERYLNNK